ncbi:hypothetical protein cyc_02567 [Cyclospora cayetanensis]|uniref:Uncharacterized protein n=1 Tax=Cyclospora cayetanensis TaxID=88456 RepID=A0A1D3CYU6_9EIME|nr:hypothetical protein cyc_02567 [Cyclospora cayetanensis]
MSKQLNNGIWPSGSRLLSRQKRRIKGRPNPFTGCGAVKGTTENIIAVEELSGAHSALGPLHSPGLKYVDE